jgi:hypothetical protein
MEIANLRIVIAVLLLVVGSSLGIMLWAYQGAGSVSALFAEVMPMPPVSVGIRPLSEEAQRLFQEGVSGYIRGKYRRSVDRFSRVVAAEAGCAAAVHNLGLALANSRQDDKATAQLLKAGTLYLQAEDPASAALVKLHLNKLRSAVVARRSPVVPQGSA